MGIVQIEIDEEELESARTLGGHWTATEAVAEALRQYNQHLVRSEQRLNRAAALRYYFELAQDWDIEGAEAAHVAEKRAYKR
ncbi:type II toxin-antitoxin system VapB family antitoxin [Nocardia rhamnosiphila]|uniref:type II toxin-antitoxin system VapB family antitoxin n=1 Tax=Nocardia rhamnosiphila TaxID=426716 RepID=UPI0004C35201|nr:type II toxin-antitoxin system VapB family antitoxin [Nocardia rhamnosiphila]